MGGAGGIVEIDQTIYGRAATRSKERRRQPGRKIVNSAHKNVVLSLVGRGGQVRRLQGEALAQEFGEVRFRYDRKALDVEDEQRTVKIVQGRRWQAADLPNDWWASLVN